MSSLFFEERSGLIYGSFRKAFSEDKIQVIGTDEELNQFGTEMEKASALDTNVVEKSETILRQFRVDEQSEFLGKTMRELGIREKYHCLIVGVEGRRSLACSLIRMSRLWRTMWYG